MYQDSLLSLSFPALVLPPAVAAVAAAAAAGQADERRRTAAGVQVLLKIPSSLTLTCHTHSPSFLCRGKRRQDLRSFHRPSHGNRSDAVVVSRGICRRTRAPPSPPVLSLSSPRQTEKGERKEEARGREGKRGKEANKVRKHPSFLS